MQDVDIPADHPNPVAHVIPADLALAVPDAAVPQLDRQTAVRDAGMVSKSDIAGMKMAYATDTGFFEDKGVLYIAGSHDILFGNQKMMGLSDWANNLRIPAGKLPGGGITNTPRYIAGKNILATRKKFIHKVVGHSLGAGASEALGKELGIEWEAYSPPGYNTSELSIHKHRSRGDPFSMFDSEAITTPSLTWDAHSLDSFKTSAYGDEIQPPPLKRQRRNATPVVRVKKKQHGVWPASSNAIPGSSTDIQPASPRPTRGKESVGITQSPPRARRRIHYRDDKTGEMRTAYSLNV